MLVKEFQIFSDNTSNTIDVPTIYKFITFFNNSSHELTLFKDTDILSNFALFNVSPFQYVTYPLEGVGTVASCQRIQKFTLTSIRRETNLRFPNIKENIRLILSDENFGVNNYQHTNASINVAGATPVLDYSKIWNFTTDFLYGGNAITRTAFGNLRGVKDHIHIVTGIQISIPTNFDGSLRLQLYEGSPPNSIFTVQLSPNPRAGVIYSLSGAMIRNCDILPPVMTLPQPEPMPAPRVGVGLAVIMFVDNANTIQPQMEGRIEVSGFSVKV